MSEVERRLLMAVAQWSMVNGDAGPSAFGSKARADAWRELCVSYRQAQRERDNPAEAR